MNVSQELDPRDGGLQPCVLVTRDGARHVYSSFRQWGRIQRHGVWFVSKRMKESMLPAHVYIEEAST